jgi:hypothetical protein
MFALVGTALTAMLTNQFRMYARTQEAGRVQRDLRAGLTLLPMDLRAASRAAGDLTLLVDSAVQLRSTIGASIVCERPSATEIVIPPRNLARNVLSPWHADPLPGDTVLLYNDSLSFGPEDDVWTPREVRGFGAAPANLCAGAPFTDPVLDPPASKPRIRVTLTQDMPAGVRVGAPIRFLRSVRYSLYRPAGVTDRWYLGYREYTAGQWGEPEPVAGPFRAYAGGSGAGGESGVSFAYYDSAGVQLAAPAPGTRVSRIDLTMRAATRVRGGADSVVVRDSIAARIALRNRW